MLKNIFFWLTAASILTVSGLEAQTTNPKTAEAAKDTKHFGERITAKKAVSYKVAMQKMSKVDSLDMKVKGEVGSVCQKKGCWMTIRSGEPGKPDMRVTFKDYAFFMPKDLSGKHVVVDGYAYVETTSVEMLRHYAEDAGKTKEEIAAITQPKREVAFEATGVLVLD